MQTATWFSARGRKAALALLATALLVQAAFGALSSSCHVSPLLEVGAICLIPAAVFMLTKFPASSAAASAALIPFLLWANYHECVRPYSGGGAAMAYVVVFLFGIPISLVAGVITFASFWKQQKQTKG
jgi:hypothetical protein